LKLYLSHCFSFVDDSNQEYYQSPSAKEIIELLRKKAEENGHSFEVEEQ